MKSEGTHKECMRMTMNSIRKNERTQEKVMQIIAMYEACIDACDQARQVHDACEQHANRLGTLPSENRDGARAYVQYVRTVGVYVGVYVVVYSTYSTLQYSTVRE